MTWQFYGGTLDQGPATRENIVFAIAMDPRKIRTMMDELEDIPPEQAAPLDAAVAKMLANRRGIILGKDRLAALNKRVGERFTDLQPDVPGHRPGVRDCGRFSAGALGRLRGHERRLPQRGDRRLRPQARQLPAPAGRQAAEPGLAAAARRGGIQPRRGPDRLLARTTPARR